MGLFRLRVNIGKGELCSTASNSLGLVQAHRHWGAVIMFNTKTEDQYYDLRPGEGGLLLSSLDCFCVVAGQLSFTPLNMQAFCKLQAFLDTASERGFVTSKTFGTQLDEWNFFPMSVVDNLTLKTIENWMIQQTFADPSSISKIADKLRKMEEYWLTHFFIQHSDGAERLYDLGVRYGVSTSHFRRISRIALGNTAKVELQNWRLSRALLDLIESDRSLTDIAMDHGYSSLSHFSNTVKKLYGVPPGSLKNVIIREIKNDTCTFYEK